jgi:hypothetical protein
MTTKRFHAVLNRLSQLVERPRSQRGSAATENTTGAGTVGSGAFDLKRQ